MMIIKIKNLKKLQDAVSQARIQFAAAEVAFETIKQSVLDAKAYYEEKTGERITSPIGDWCMSEEDFVLYIAEIDKIYYNLGIKEGHQYLSYCGAKLKTAENKLIDAGLSILPAPLMERVRKSIQLSLKARKEVVGLNMSFTEIVKKNELPICGR